MIKLSLDSVGYGGYFTDGEHVPLEEAMQRAAKFGYDAVCFYAHRPMAFPMDIDQDRRKRLKEQAQSLDIELGAVVACTNFMKGNHALIYPQEKEILYVRDCIDLAKDMDMKIVRVLAAFYGYFQNPYANGGQISISITLFLEHSRFLLRSIPDRLAYQSQIASQKS